MYIRKRLNELVLFATSVRNLTDGSTYKYPPNIVSKLFFMLNMTGELGHDIS